MAHGVLEWEWFWVTDLFRCRWFVSNRKEVFTVYVTQNVMFYLIQLARKLWSLWNLAYDRFMKFVNFTWLVYGIDKVVIFSTFILPLNQLNLLPYVFASSVLKKGLTYECHNTALYSLCISFELFTFTLLTSVVSHECCADCAF